MKKYILLLLCLIAFSCSTSETNPNDETNQGFNIADDKYPSIVGNYINYLNNKDIEGIKSLVTDDIQVSSSNGNFTNGIVELEDNLKNWLLNGDYKWRGVWGVPFVYNSNDEFDGTVTFVGAFDIKSTTENEINVRNLMINFIFQEDKIHRIYAHTREFNPSEKELVIKSVNDGNF